MNILVLASEYPYEKDTNADRTKVVGYFAKEWVKQGHSLRRIMRLEIELKVLFPKPLMYRERLIDCGQRDLHTMNLVFMWRIFPSQNMCRMASSQRRRWTSSSKKL